ncbi:marine proteobacterial sortase target protein [Denitromonas iodatirespirans]|uniref:Marine proteobacterial sortase target protein n=1 Tax=Denitromonas iodatirespirans TaxID=2795389 RepID=A0A944DHQ5_DENI1|nr:marine proteobacterial sortase target protein [Denitromonas iodatirespirans]MBT0963078.1 marine proteobacterial sortase target protein [Denitromonas iodatirespirans]
MTPAPLGFRDRAREVAELLARLLLMFVTGLGVSLALGALVLMLAAPAQAAESGDGGVQQGTLLFRGADGGDPAAAPLLHTDVTLRVSGPIVRARVVQRFRNPADDWREGTYVFPLPENAAVDRMRIQVADRVIEGQIQERAQAKATYEKAKAEGKASALVSQERPNVFTTRVANIGPKDEIRVEIEYQHTLDYAVADGVGRYSLRFPMVVAPRYIPGQVVGDEESGAILGTDMVPDAAAILPPMLLPDEAGPIVNPVSLNVYLDAGVPIAAVDSPFHRVRIDTLKPSVRRIRLSEGRTPANRDFVLNWTLAAGAAPHATLFVEPGKDRDHALLMLVPPAPSAVGKRLPREVVFIVDTSGSMEGASIVQAREALAMALGRLGAEDSFNVIEFNSNAKALFDTARPASGEHVAQAVRWVQALRANGGTEMAGALDLALDGRRNPDRVRQVIFLTDGAVGNEAQLFGLIQQRLGDSRLFTVGIGSAPNSHFMRKAAQAGRGSFTYIGKVEEVRARMAELFAKLESPVIKGLTVTWPSGARADASPDPLPDLYLGEPVVVAAAIDRTVGGEVRLSGDSGAIRWSSSLSLDDANPGEGIGVLWARQKIDHWMDTLADGADEAAVREKVLALALEFQLVSQFTSFVAVDTTPARSADARLKSGAVPSHFPAGWSPSGVYGELPRGATDTRWHVLMGLIALAAFFLTRTPRVRQLTMKG